MKLFIVGSDGERTPVPTETVLLQSPVGVFLTAVGLFSPGKSENGKGVRPLLAPSQILR